MAYAITPSRPRRCSSLHPAVSPDRYIPQARNEYEILSPLSAEGDRHNLSAATTITPSQSGPASGVSSHKERHAGPLFQFSSPLAVQSHRKKTLSISAARGPAIEDVTASVEDGEGEEGWSKDVARKKTLPSAPTRVLDAPGLLNDFYTSPLTASSKGVLAVALGETVYTVEKEEEVEVLLTLDENVSCMSFDEDGDKLAVASGVSSLRIVDMRQSSKPSITVRDSLKERHAALVAWASRHNSHLLAVAFHTPNMYWDRVIDYSSLITLLDSRYGYSEIAKVNTTQLGKICAMQWSPCGYMLAAGGNDNTLTVWRFIPPIRKRTKITSSTPSSPPSSQREGEGKEGEEGESSLLSGGCEGDVMCESEWTGERAGMIREGGRRRSGEEREEDDQIFRVCDEGAVRRRRTKERRGSDPACYPPPSLFSFSATTAAAGGGTTSSTASGISSAKRKEEGEDDDENEEERHTRSLVDELSAISPSLIRRRQRSEEGARRSTRRSLFGEEEEGESEGVSSTLPFIDYAPSMDGSEESGSGVSGGVPIGGGGGGGERWLWGWGSGEGEGGGERRGENRELDELDESEIRATTDMEERGRREGEEEEDGEGEGEGEREGERSGEEGGEMMMIDTSFLDEDDSVVKMGEREGMVVDRVEGERAEKRGGERGGEGEKEEEEARSPSPAEIAIPTTTSSTRSSGAGGGWMDGWRDREWRVKRQMSTVEEGEERDEAERAGGSEVESGGGEEETPSPSNTMVGANEGDLNEAFISPPPSSTYLYSSPPPAVPSPIPASSPPSIHERQDRRGGGRGSAFTPMSVPRHTSSPFSARPPLHRHHTGHRRSISDGSRLLSVTHRRSTAMGEMGVGEGEEEEQRWERRRGRSMIERWEGEREREREMREKKKSRVVIVKEANVRCIFSTHEHKAAIKALAWSPEGGGILASGGGAMDRQIIIWNVIDGRKLRWIDTGNQICSLLWSITTNELVTTESGTNTVSLWNASSLDRIAAFPFHRSRVLYSVLMPAGDKVVAAGADSILSFWDLFPRRYEKKVKKHGSNLLDFTSGSPIR